MEQKMLDRATYKKIKGMTREEMQRFRRLILVSLGTNLAVLRALPKSG